jgi:uncharacterized protein YcnI
MSFKLHTTILAGIAIVATTLLFGTIAQAHVTVKPAQASPASFETFTVSVPNEKTQSTIRVKLLIPEGVEHVTPTQKSGWKITSEKDAKGVVSSITWSDGEIGEGFRDEFSFSAKLPATPSEIQWKAYQTYADGTIVAWDQGNTNDNHDEKNKGPFSVTTIKEAASVNVENNDVLPQPSGLSFYIATAALVVGFVAVFFSTRKIS